MSIERASPVDPAEERLEIGSMIDGLGPELGDQLVHLDEVPLEPVERRPRRLDPEQALLDPGLEVDPDRAHVADDLGPRLLEGEVEAALPPLGRPTW